MAALASFAVALGRFGGADSEVGVLVASNLRVEVTKVRGEALKLIAVQMSGKRLDLFVMIQHCAEESKLAESTRVTYAGSIGSQRMFRLR